MLVADQLDIEWVIVNFNSTDGLDAMMMEKLGHLTTRIAYFRETSGRAWHASIAKNVAHRVATGEILMNLDCDNFIGNALDAIREYFQVGYRLLHLFSGFNGDGTYGRIVIDRDVFHAVGGYDESFYPMAYQDADLLQRATAIGTRGRRVHCPRGLALPNTKEQSVINCAMAMTWDDFHFANQARSQANMAAGRFVANAPDGWSFMQIERVNVPRVSCAQ
jgi:glycosyltransferase involved in cell wall biosynthesis